MLDYLPSFFLGGTGGSDFGAGSDVTTAGVFSTTAEAAFTGSGAAGAIGCSTGCGVVDRLRSRSSMTSVGGFSIVSWIFFKMLSNES